MPHVQRGGQGSPPLRLGEIQHGGGATRQRRQGAGGPAVRRLPGRILVHLEVGVGVDEAGEHQLARRVQHPAVPRGEVGANFRDFVPHCPQVGPDRALGASQGAVLDQNGHSNSSFLRGSAPGLVFDSVSDKRAPPALIAPARFFKKAGQKALDAKLYSTCF